VWPLADTRADPSPFSGAGQPRHPKGNTNMNNIPRFLRRVFHLARRASWAALAAYFWLITSDMAWAAKAHKKVVEEVETKSYVFPYIIVIFIVGIGLMAVCRPGSRLDKIDDKIKEKEDA
jgi:hypothetical protein